MFVEKLRLLHEPLEEFPQLERCVVAKLLILLSGNCSSSSLRDRTSWLDKDYISHRAPQRADGRNPFAAELRRLFEFEGKLTAGARAKVFNFIFNCVFI